MDVSLEEIVRRSRPAHVVFASSGAVYGDGTPGALSEGSPTLGSSAYALSKLATEDLLRTLSEELPSLAVTALRIFNIAGPSFADSLVQRLLRADPDHPVQVRNPDSFVRDYIHQADTVLAVARAVERPRAGFRALNVGTGYAVSTRMLLESLAIPDEAWIEVPGVASTSWCDNAAMIRELDIVPHALPTRAWGAPTLH
jgi:UDP-glucose 4-epimerase